MLVFIGNLTWTTTEDEITTFVRNIGGVVNITIKRHSDTQRSKGWGLIEFSSIEKANEAVALLDGTTLAGRQVHLRLDRTLEPKPEGVGVFVGNIPWDVSREDIVTFFASHRPKDCLIATNMVGKSRGFCILLFDDEATANQVIEKYHQADFNGRLLECHLDSEQNHKQRDKSNRVRVFVGGIPVGFDDQQLQTLFSRAGEVASASIRETDTVEGPKRWGLVKFTANSDAKKAVKMFNGFVTGGDELPLVVRFDRK